MTRPPGKLNLGGSLHPPSDPVARRLLTALAKVASRPPSPKPNFFARTREDMQVARATGRLRAKQPSSPPTQSTSSPHTTVAGRYTSAELAEPFGGARATIDRAVNRAPPAATSASRSQPGSSARRAAG